MVEDKEIIIKALRRRFNSAAYQLPLNATLYNDYKERFSIECRLRWFYFPALCDWLTKLAPLFQPIRN